MSSVFQAALHEKEMLTNTFDLTLDFWINNVCLFAIFGKYVCVYIYILFIIDNNDIA